MKPSGFYVDPQEEQTLQAGSATHQTRTISVFHTSNLVKLNKS